MNKKYIIVGVFLLCGCNSVIIPQSFQYKEVVTDDFTLASWQKLTDSTAPVKFYIEGDGFAFNAHGQPTSDPTPHGKMIREMAFGDNSPNVVYLARPCQYVMSAKCQQRYWTTARFAPETVRSTFQAIQKIAPDKELILVGFSGGAQVAGLVAVREPSLKVKKLITVGGNLDHQAWTAYHHLPDLAESLNLKDYQQTYLKIPQVHYVGKKDEIITPQLNVDFAGANNVVIVDDASHGSGWESIYTAVWDER